MAYVHTNMLFYFLCDLRLSILDTSLDCFPSILDHLCIGLKDLEKQLKLLNTHFKKMLKTGKKNEEVLSEITGQWYKFNP
jgi:hypothetical protein